MKITCAMCHKEWREKEETLKHAEMFGVCQKCQDKLNKLMSGETDLRKIQAQEVLTGTN